MTDTTTEILDLPLEAHHVKALKNADWITFRGYQGQATVEAGLREEHSPTGFEQRTTVYCGPTQVEDYSKGNEEWVRERVRTHGYSCFTMIHASKFCPPIQTIVRRLKAGQRLQLRWVRSNNTDTLDKYGLVHDELRLVVLTAVKAKYDGLPITWTRDEYNIDEFVGEDNSARYCRIA